MRIFRKEFGLALTIVLAFLLLFSAFFCSGCRIFKNQKSASKDSLVVSDNKGGNSKFDSLNNKSDKTNTKETVYYPQPIIVPGKDGETKIVFVPQTVKETGTEKTEETHLVKDTSWHEAFNSLALLIANKEKEVKVKAGPSFIEWILIAGLALVLIKNFIPFKITKI